MTTPQLPPEKEKKRPVIPGAVGAGDPNTARANLTIQGWKQKYQGKDLRPAYTEVYKPTTYEYGYTPPQTQEQTVQAMPNYDKLTPLERGIYAKLPGFTESSVGQALARFGGSWAGKALSWLDIAAEGLERTTGLAAQYLNTIGNEQAQNDFMNNLGNAWYAGSLAADFANLPQFRRDETGKITGMTMPTDLPGVGGLVQARNQIAELTSQGMDPGDALEQVRSQYYNQLGALQLRSQLYDTYFHVLADPLNVILPQLKPVETIQKWRKTIMATKIPEEGFQILRDAEKVAREAGNLQEATEIAGAIERAQGLTRMDKFIVAISGGDPFKPIGKFSKWNPLALTPAARAQELLTVVTDMTQTKILANLTEPAEKLSAIQRAVRTGLDTYGHAFTTIEGRTVHAALSGFEIEATNLYGAYVLAQDDYILLKTLASAIDEIPDNLLNLALKDDGVRGLARRLADVGSEITADDLRTLAEKLNGLPYSPELFNYQLANKLADHAARQGIVQFGVEARGFLEKVSMAMKAGETMAFLRMNPAYAVRNVVNNELTMIARGITGAVTQGDIEKFWTRLGFEPLRLGQGFGAIGEGLITPGEVGSKVIYDALRGERGFLDKITDTIGNIKIPGDMGKFSASAEARASRRAFTIGYMQGWKKYFWKAGKGYDPIEKVISSAAQTAAEQRYPGILKSIERMVGDAWSPEDIEKGIRGNLNITPSAIFDETSRQLGYDVTKALPEEFVAKIETGLSEAAERGTVRDFMIGLRDDLQNHLDELNASTVENAAAYIENKVIAEGPGALPRIWGDVMDEFWGAHTEHALNMETLAATARATTDPQITRDLWEKVFTQNEAYWSRAWDRLHGTIKGMKQGARKAGIQVPDEVLTDFKTIESSTREFFTFRNKELEAFFKARMSGKPPRVPWDELQAELDTKYQGLIQLEDDLTRQIDERVAQALPSQEMTDAYKAWRSRARELRRLDKEFVVQFRQEIAGLSPKAREEAYARFWKQRFDNFEGSWRNERQGLQMMSGDPAATQQFQRLSDEQLLVRVEDYLGTSGKASGASQGLSMAFRDGQIPADQYRQLLRNLFQDDEEALTELGKIFGPERPPRGQLELPLEGEGKTFIADSDKLQPQPPPTTIGEDQFWLNRGNRSLDAIEQATLTQAEKKPLKYARLPGEVKAEVEQYLNRVKGQMGDARYAAVRFGEFKRDAALLNYNRRFNYNTYFGMLAPYEFWLTQSIMKWAIHSIDRPAMFTTYLRIKKMLETAGAPNQALPTRLKGSVRISLPFLPEWMGTQLFTDPMRLALPFDTFAYPYEQLMQNQTTVEGRASRIIQKQVQDGLITAEQADQAMTEKAGPIWEQARAEAVANDEDLRFDAWDFMSLLTSPHAPLQWAYETLRGTPENIGPFTPLTRMSKGVSALLGVQDFPLLPHNIEAKVRKTLGLPAFDKWDDYRVERMLSNMAATNEITVDEAQRAMIEHSGSAWDEAQRKAGIEFGVGAVGGILGIPIKSYPEGEFLQRSLTDDFNRAYEAYNKGDTSVLTAFFDNHPEYETRLALFKEPEERLRQFLVDELWNTYNDFPKLNKKEIREQLGPEFNALFINKDTRSYDSIDLATMQSWLKLMGADPPGSLNSPNVPLLELTDRDKAYRIDTFNATRNRMFPDWYDIQSGYFLLEKGDARKNYLKKHQSLKIYWDWRNDFLKRNPDIAPMLTDNFEEVYTGEKQLQQALAQTPNFSWQEYQTMFGLPLSRLVLDDLVGGQNLPMSARNQLEDIADQIGLSGAQELLSRVDQSLEWSYQP